MKTCNLLCLLIGTYLLFGCDNVTSINQDNSVPEILIEANDFLNTASNKVNNSAILISEDEELVFEIDVKTAGRYKVEVHAKSENNAIIWLEDHINNKDERTYDITGKVHFPAANSFQTAHKDGSPLNIGKHEIKIHVSESDATLKWIKFTLIQAHQETPIIHKQNMIGTDWNLVWSDEFDGSGLPDSTKWSYNIGNWGWGNNEPQYYTNAKQENARIEDGNLIIEAWKTGSINEWTSARLTTQGKETFLYGKIEFRAKVPVGRGTWAAGWLLGDDYRDELSWPYCGEIDVLECVGFEIDDSTGNGKNHATCHTRSYYFKQGNQIGADTNMQAMNTAFHTYAIEWYPDVIYGLVDGKRYYTYDKNKDELEWPFNKPQNIIVNLAIGGGWGGAKGIDSTWDKHQYILDYVRVYELK